MDDIAPPWTDEQVQRLNAFQHAGRMHPFTCGNDECRKVHRDPLVATASGWKCQFCDYTQQWAHGFMADGSRETHWLFR